MPNIHASSLLPFRPDVLIVGGGFAALIAAFAVREKGRTVAIVSLGPVGRSGNTVVAGGLISSAFDTRENTAERYLEDLLASGKGLADTELAERLAFESSSMLERLQDLGVVFASRDGEPDPILVGGHSVRRTFSAECSNIPVSTRGRAFMEPLLPRLAGLNVPMLKGLRVTSLLRQGDRVVGVTARERESETSHTLLAGSVILATGGYGGLFRRTNNVSDIYGDGIGLALEAGGTLRDMEMVQFYPTVMLHPVRKNINGRMFAMGAVLRNGLGERFMDSYDPAGDLATRDVMARAIFLEIQAGRGKDGFVLVDCTGIPKDVLHGKYGPLYRFLRKKGLDMSRDMLPGVPTTHYTLGGIRIDPDGRTGVPGLYAAGEVCGGVHGVNRLAGAAIMEAAVFGHRAGLAAATEAPEAPLRYDSAQMDEGVGSLWSSCVDADMLVLRSLLWDHISLFRNAEGMTKALEGIMKLRAKYSKDSTAAGKAFARNLLVGEAVARSAMKRTESRGAHYRSDYPETDPAWAKPVCCALRGNELHFVE